MKLIGVIAIVVSFIILLSPNFIKFKIHEPDICLAPFALPSGNTEILVISDSIGHGYKKYLSVPGHTIVALPEDSQEFCNAESSQKTREYIDVWLAQRQSFDIVLWNNGLWDISSNEKYTGRVSPDGYRKNLLIIGAKIKAKSKHPYFVLTTHVPEGAAWRRNTDVITYNTIAISVMKKLGIPVIDLYAVSAAHPELHIDPTDVHFSPAGYELLGKAISNKLNSQDNSN